MNYHVHQHIILTAGGLSLDGNGWIELSHHHPALHARALADQLRTTFLRRLRGRLKRGELVWPAEEIGMSQEAFFEGMSRKPWIASSQPPTIQTGDDAGQAAGGAQGIVHYLAAYVSGTAIGNGRIIDDDGQMVRFQFKDYRTGKLGIEELTGVEFTRRFCQHVWPKSIRKVRYGGLFAARGRVERMVRCNELIYQSVAATTGVAQDNQASTDSKFSGDLDTSGDIEEAPTMTGCRCRYCQGQLAVTCRLKGLPTQRLMSLVAAITGLLPALSEQVIATLKTNLPCTPRELKRIRQQCLPRTVADVMSGLTLDYEHSQALFAFIDWVQESRRTASMFPFKPP